MHKLSAMQLKHKCAIICIAVTSQHCILQVYAICRRSPRRCLSDCLLHQPANNPYLLDGVDLPVVRDSDQDVTKM